jgi:maleylacetate reductase
MSRRRYRRSTSADDCDAEKDVMTEPFVFNGLPSRVVFGWGTLRDIGNAVQGLGARRALVLATPEQEARAQEVAALLGDLAVGVFAGATMHTPVEVTKAAMQTYHDGACDCVVSVGGGSTIGLGKAIVVREDCRQVAVPTTYAGSEMTPILGETQAGRKTTRRDPKILPEVVIYDVDLTFSLPPGLTATSGMNAIAHAVEALYAKDRNPIISLMSQEAIRALGAALPVLVKDPHDREARGNALYGAWLAGAALGSVGMALHHKLCHTLGGSFGLPHSETHTIVLPHATAFNAVAVPQLLAPVAAALGAEKPGQALYDLARRIGAPVALKTIGLEAPALDEAAAIATENPYWNPRPFGKDDIRALLEDAYHGRRPEH